MSATGLNYYKRYPGDYMRDTGHLSLAEHGAYTLLLDHYYSTGGLPKADADLYRLCRAMKRAEQLAVKRVAEQFFPGRRNPRADEEIEKWNQKASRNRTVGVLGGRPKSIPEETQTVSNSEPTGNPLQKPEARSQKPEEALRASDAPPARAKGTPAGEMAVALRDLGVQVTSQHPTLLAWLRDGYTVRQAADAVALARMRKPYPEPIAANYLDPILRQPTRPPPKSQLERVTWRPPPDEASA